MKKVIGLLVLGSILALSSIAAIAMKNRTMAMSSRMKPLSERCACSRPRPTGQTAQPISTPTPASPEAPAP